MRNRIIAIVLVVALIPCCFAVNASAAGTKDSIINLMDDTNSYSMNINDNGYYATGYNSHVTNAISAVLSWSLPTAIDVDYMYFTIKTSASPSTVNVDFNSKGNFYKSEFLGSNGEFLYYKQPYGSSVGSISIKLTFDTHYTGFYELVSCFAVRENAFLLDKVSLQNQALLYEADEDELYRYIFENKDNASLPVSSTHVTNYIKEPVDPLIEGLLFTHIVSEWIPFDYADSITFVFYSSGSVKDAGFSLLDKSGNYVGQLEVDLVELSYIKSVDWHFPSGSNMEWPWYSYSATVDLSGYDLSELNLSFFCSVDPVNLIDYESYTGYSFTLSSVILYPTIEDEPWYARFGKWITGGFNSVVSGLTSGFNSVVNAISSVFNPAGSDELSQVGDDLSQSAGDIDSAGDVLGSVDQPDVNSGDLIGGFTNFDTGGLRVLSCLTSNAQVTQMMVVVFTFSLAGYIFFGKKG